MVKVQHHGTGRIQNVTANTARVLVHLKRAVILPEDNSVPSAPVVTVEPVVEAVLDLTPPAPVEVPAPVEMPAPAPVGFEPSPVVSVDSSPVLETTGSPHLGEDEPRKKRKYTRRDMSADKAEG